MCCPGGYKKLTVYRKSDVIYQGKVAFCRRFLPAHGDHTVRSDAPGRPFCNQNIAEGFAAASEAASRVAEIKCKADQAAWSICRRKCWQCEDAAASPSFRV